MPARRKAAPAKSPQRGSPPSLEVEVQAVLAALKRLGTKRTRDGMAGYGIHATKAFGVTMAHMQQVAKRHGKNHELALALWETEWYEARMLTSFIDEPARVTAAQMDRWCREFDNWAICDTLCFHLFDRTPHAWQKIEQWSNRRDEFGKRAAFALLACVALHDKKTDDEPFLDSLALVERAATDERNFVKKAVNWALRAVGERSPDLNAAAVKVARRLADSEDATARWVGKDALRKLTGPVVKMRLAARSRRGSTK